MHACIRLQAMRSKDKSMFYGTINITLLQYFEHMEQGVHIMSPVHYTRAMHVFVWHASCKIQ